MEKQGKEVKSYAEKLKQGLGQTSARVEMCKEMADQEARKGHVIVRGVEESEAESGEERKSHDIKCVQSICRNIDLDFEEGAIKAARRLGKQSSEKKYRPLLIKVDEQLREKMIYCKSRLRKLNEEQDTRYRFDPDLTQAQQEQYNRLWEEANCRNRTSKNGVRWVVWGPRENPWLKRWEDRKESTQEERK